MFGRVLITKKATRYALLKKMFLDILQYLQKNTCTRVSFLIKLQDETWNRDSITGAFLQILGNF